MAYKPHTIPRRTDGSLHGSKGTQRGHGRSVSGRQIRVRAERDRLYHRPRSRLDPIRAPDTRGREEVLAPACVSDDPRQQAPEGEGRRRQGEGQREHDPAEVLPGRHAHDHRIQQRLGSGVYSGPVHHRRRARPLGGERRHRGRPMEAGRSKAGDVLQREGRRSIDANDQGRFKHRDGLLPRHAGTLVPPVP